MITISFQLENTDEALDLLTEIQLGIEDERLFKTLEEIRSDLGESCEGVQEKRYDILRCQLTQGDSDDPGLSKPDGLHEG